MGVSMQNKGISSFVADYQVHYDLLFHTAFGGALPRFAGTAVSRCGSEHLSSTFWQGTHNTQCKEWGKNRPDVMVHNRSPHRNRVPWKDALSEDMYFCHAAADLYQELHPALRPAPMELEIPFSIETIWHEAPFAVHQFWPHLHVNTPAMATTLLENCPEALGILPADLFANQTVWRDIVCAANLDRFYGTLDTVAYSILRECPRG